MALLAAMSIQLGTPVQKAHEPMVTGAQSARRQNSMVKAPMQMASSTKRWKGPPISCASSRCSQTRTQPPSAATSADETLQAGSESMGRPIAGSSTQRQAGGKDWMRMRKVEKMMRKKSVACEQV